MRVPVGGGLVYLEVEEVELGRGRYHRRRCRSRRRSPSRDRRCAFQRA